MKSATAKVSLRQRPFLTFRSACLAYYYCKELSNAQASIMYHAAFRVVIINLI